MTFDFFCGILDSIMREYGEPKKQFSFVADPVIRKILEEESSRQERSVAWIINRYLLKSFQSAGLLPSKTETDLERNRSDPAYS
ncbi:hypothetical protein FACS1894172_12660 [Spirochaetia bacterium]|nr:hypothetical protein FACS1894172_12660 [Spirochaetia bacterium]